MRALLTGASRRGIGGAIGFRLARDDLCITLSATGKNPDLYSLASDLKELGADVLVVAGDLADPDFPEKLVQEAAAFSGGLDLVISNAGQTWHGQLVDANLADWDTALAHPRAAWLLAKAAFPFLKASHGSFIATGSISGTFPHADHGMYVIAKAALIMLCQTLAVEWGPAGVRVNVVSPGTVRTQANAKSYAADIVPLGRAALPEDIAGVVAFLAGQDAAYITGENILVDGGLIRSGLEIIPRKNR